MPEPLYSLVIENKETKAYHVRKTNAIAYKSNFYSVPMGTYKGTGTQVIIKEIAGVLEIYSSDQELICTHRISSKKDSSSLIPIIKGILPKAWIK